MSYTLWTNSLIEDIDINLFEQTYKVGETEPRNMANINKKQEMSGRRRFLITATSMAGGIASIAWVQRCLR